MIKWDLRFTNLHNDLPFEWVRQYYRTSEGHYLCLLESDAPPYNSMSPGGYSLACVHRKGLLLWRSTWYIMSRGPLDVSYLKIHEIFPGRFAAVNLVTDPQMGTNPKIWMGFFDGNGQLLRSILHGGPDFYTGPGANSPPRWSYRPYSSCPSKDGGLLVCGHATRGNAFHAVTGPNGEHLGIVVDPQQVGPIPGGLYFFITKYSSDGDSLWTSVIPRRILYRIFENRPRSFIEKYLVFMQDSLLYSRELVPCDIRVRSDNSIDVLVRTQDFQGSGNPPGMDYPVFIFHFDEAGNYQWHYRLQLPFGLSALFCVFENAPFNPDNQFTLRISSDSVLTVAGSGYKSKNLIVTFEEDNPQPLWYITPEGQDFTYYLPDGNVLFVSLARINPQTNTWEGWREMRIYNRQNQLLGFQDINNSWPLGGLLWYTTMWNTWHFTEDGCLIIPGFYEKTQSNSDFRMIKWCPDLSLLVGLEADGAPESAMQVYPNPGAGRYHISHGQPVARLRVWDSRGVLALDVRPSEGRFSLEGRPAGLYLWEATDLEGRVHRGRLVQQAAK
ncbi:MAG: hypothetical protein N2050_04495 [Flavobacteriales bacterium]|nr:hypothetical protein [Flavobacteriales bacterium]